MINRYCCQVMGAPSRLHLPCIIVDAATEAEYAVADDDLADLKTFIWHDGSRLGLNQAEAIARSLEESGVAVRDLGQPGIVMIVAGDRHKIVNRGCLYVVDGHD